MPKVRCPRCDESVFFTIENPESGRTYRISCQACAKEFPIRIKSASSAPEEEPDRVPATVTVLENEFCHKQTLVLHLGENTIGRRCKGTVIECPVDTGDMSMDRRHAVITVRRNESGFAYALKDNRSLTGTFFAERILNRNEQVCLSDSAVFTLGATTFIFSLDEEQG